MSAPRVHGVEKRAPLRGRRPAGCREPDSSLAQLFCWYATTQSTYRFTLAGVDALGQPSQVPPQRHGWVWIAMDMGVLGTNAPDIRAHCLPSMRYTSLPGVHSTSAVCQPS